MSLLLERDRPEDCLSDLVLDRLVVGELSRRDESASHLSTCSACRARLEHREREHREFDVAPPMVDAAAAPIDLQAARRARGPKRFLVAGSVLSSLALAAVILLLVRPAPESTIRRKGAFAIELVARRTSGRVEHLVPGAELSPGDAIRFRMASDRDGFLAVIGIDAAKTVTPYVPADGRAIPLASTRDRLLDGSVILDETLGDERIVALLCTEQLAVGDVVEAARRALARAHDEPRRVGDLGLPCSQTSTLITKIAAPAQ